ncbi:2OG-Fe(II) oxygenase [Parvularcula sp. LCG005]|uniref:2OG-Fe(II) oxygenase n=1 Tax=Parvularcula sp. LCG005 TaxID=3078805 RepID=UPI002943D76A|nr:2OG-Fe(II) oxygenase [Parvularcula sp. LCG005]WOI53197.1 2OG-Fe(II) oxygenase [Parvularcula sp. LCG005]
MAPPIWRWVRGRQASGYDKMLLATLPIPLPWDCYLLRFPTGSEIPPHTDPVTGKRHYRLNIVIRQADVGGEFFCADPIYATRRIKFFRPDRSEHAVSRVEAGTRYVLSIGWVRRSTSRP